MLLALTTAAVAGLPANSFAGDAQLRNPPQQAGSPAQILPRAEATAECGPIDAVLGMLRHRYGERVFWWGQTADDVTLLVTQRPDTRTWTLLAVHGGEACLVGSGGAAGAQGS